MRLTGVLFFCCLAIHLACATETNMTLTVEGVTYSNVTFGAATPAAVTVFHSAGIASIPLEKLPGGFAKEIRAMTPRRPSGIARWKPRREQQCSRPSNSAFKC